MRNTWICFSLLGMACASAPAPVATQPVLPDMKKPPITPVVTPLKVDTNLALGISERVALIWGDPKCGVRPWVVTVVDLGARAITFRALAATSELGLYFPSPTGEACYKGPCPTMAVVMAIPPSLSGPSLYSGTGTMMGGTGKGLYALPSGTSCPEPPILADGDLVDLAMRLVQGRNEAAAAVAARGPAR